MDFWWIKSRIFGLFRRHLSVPLGRFAASSPSSFLPLTHSLTLLCVCMDVYVCIVDDSRDGSTKSTDLPQAKMQTYLLWPVKEEEEEERRKKKKKGAEKRLTHSVLHIHTVYSVYA